MKIAIMQPYFLPYIGYFQLINSVDKFVIYDDVKYTKKGWINRNRIISNGKELTFSIPLKKDSDYLKIADRKISTDFDKEKFLRIIFENYKKAKNFEDIYRLIKSIVCNSTNNLFDFIYYSIAEICNYLNIKTELVISSTLDYDREGKGVEMVLNICKKLNARTYINPIGGIELYNKDYFADSNIDLFFLKSYTSEYSQFNIDFLPALSVIDVLMMNSKDEVIEMINKDYELITT